MAELIQRLSFEEYQMWFAYYNIEPFGELRDDFRIGQLCATVANIAGASDKKTLEATDFIPTYDSIEAEKVKESISNMNKSIGDSFKSLRNLAKADNRVNI